MLYNKFVEINDLEEIDRTYSGLPIYRYKVQKVFPLEVNDDDMDRIRNRISRYPMELIQIDIPTDEDIVKYWGGQTIYLVSYDHKSKLDSVFVVDNVVLEYDEDYYELESFVVTILPLRRRH